MRTALFACLCLLLVACSPERRLQRLLRNHPELNRVDTIRDTVRVEIPGERFDTAIVIYMHDTVRIDTGRLHVRIIRTAPDSFFVEGKCDTVWRDVPYEVVVERVVPCPPGKRVAAWWRTAALIFGGLFFLLLVLGLWRGADRRD